MPTIPNMPSLQDPIEDSTFIPIVQANINYKITFTQLFAKIDSRYSTTIIDFLQSSNQDTARRALAIDRRVEVNDSDYNILFDNKVVAQVGNMTSPRTFNLPAAATLAGGSEIIIIDESGTVNVDNEITIRRTGTDLIDGATFISLVEPYGKVQLISNGLNSWKVLSAGPAIIDTTKNKNLIINGNMNISQRYTSYNITERVFLQQTFPIYSLDRWFSAANTNTGAATGIEEFYKIGQGFRPISNYVNVRTLKMTVLNSYNYTRGVACIGQVIDRGALWEIKDQPFTISFWVKSNRIGTYCISLQGIPGSTSPNYVAEYNINIANTWELKVINVPRWPAVTSIGSIPLYGDPGDFGMLLTFTLACAGAVNQTAPNAWIFSGRFFGTSNQVNFFSAVSNEFEISGVQLERGYVRTVQAGLPSVDELQLCKAYFEYGRAKYSGVGSTLQHNAQTYNYSTSKILNPPSWNPRVEIVVNDSSNITGNFIASISLKQNSFGIDFTVTDSNIAYDIDWFAEYDFNTFSL